MSKKISAYIFFIIIAIISAGLILSTTRLGKEKVYPGEDDRVQILFLGDSNLAYDAQMDNLTIAQRLMERTGYNVYNCAVGGTTAAKINYSDYFDKELDLLCLYNVSKVMETQEYETLMDSFWQTSLTEQQAIERMQVLTAIDYDEIDYIVISYGLNDYAIGVPIKDDDLYNEETYEGALRSSIERISELCPNATIILSSITYCVFEDDGIVEDGYQKDWGGGCIRDYRDAASQVASEYENVIFMDNLTCLGMNRDNYTEYVFDGMHFNIAGQEKYTECLMEILLETERNKDEGSF